MGLSFKKDTCQIDIIIPAGVSMLQCLLLILHVLSCISVVIFLIKRKNRGIICLVVPYCRYHASCIYLCSWSCTPEEKWDIWYSIWSLNTEKWGHSVVVPLQRNEAYNSVVRPTSAQTYPEYAWSCIIVNISCAHILFTLSYSYRPIVCMEGLLWCLCSPHT